VQTNIFPTVYDIRNDPGEDNELMKQGLFSYSWVYGAMGQLVQSKMASMQEYRNIKPGEDFEGYE
jgi:arylsulfatase